MKVVCTTKSLLPKVLPVGVRAFTFFDPSGMGGVGNIAQGWPSDLRKTGHAPSTSVWDFVLFSFSVCAADLACPRKLSADGWTRQIELEIAVNNPAPWTRQATLAQDMLRVLTGDFWTLTFSAGGHLPPAGDRLPCDRDCVSLLSGGLDSLVGGIDACTSGRKPIFVSQRAFEDSARQRTYAAALGGDDWHRQWSHGISVAGSREPSTRARSMAFYGMGVLASSLISGSSVDLIVPENGFISVNPPLMPGRISSLSTRTTHPRFIALLQQLLQAVGVGVQLVLPYRFKTKGEVLTECQDQGLLTVYAADTTSCGRYRTYNRTHCGRCVPCMVRKAAFLRWNRAADTTTYRHKTLEGAGKTAADDPMAVASAVLWARNRGIDSFLGATLSFATGSEVAAYRGVLERGLGELEVLLSRDGLV